MAQVGVRRTVAAPVELAFARYADIPSWERWARLGRVGLARAGTPEPGGVGAIRAFRTAGWTVEEEVTAFEPPRFLAYRLLRGMPLRNHEGWVRFSAADGGTQVEWSCRFDAPAPGLGRPLRVLVSWVFRRALEGLDRELAGVTRR